MFVGGWVGPFAPPPLCVHPLNAAFPPGGAGRRGRCAERRQRQDRLRLPLRRRVALPGGEER